MNHTFNVRRSPMAPVEVVTVMASSRISAARWIDRCGFTIVYIPDRRK